MVNRLKEFSLGDDLAIEEASLGGIRLLDILEGYDRVILVDAIKTKGGVPGDVYRLEPGDFAGTLHSSSPHDLNLFTALEFGRAMGMHMPEEMVVLAVEVDDVETFNEGCCPAVSRAIPEVMEAVLEELKSSKEAA